MQKKFEINRTKSKGACQSERKVVTHNSKSDLPLIMYKNTGWPVKVESDDSLKDKPTYLNRFFFGFLNMEVFLWVGMTNFHILAFFCFSIL